MAKLPEHIVVQTKPAVKTAGVGLTLAALIGAGAAGLVTTKVNLWESGGKSPPLVAYKDIVGVWTVCDGDTQGVTSKTRETLAGCKIRLDTRLVQFAKPVLSCTPGLYGHDAQLASAIVLAYNIGAPSYCASTAAKLFRAGTPQWRKACDAFLLWDKAGGQPVKGLANRRADERALCLIGLPA